MASARTLLTTLQVAALLCCIASADVKAADKTEDDELKVTDADSNNEDLDTQETNWMLDPIQMKMRELQYLKSKFISPFMTLMAPSQFYGGGYPIYSSGGGSSFSSGLSHQTAFSGPSYSWGKPVKPLVPTYSQNNWYNKGTSGIKYQPATFTYAPDCDYITTPKPATVFVPVKPTYSSGTPLNYYYSNMAPSQIYGTPSFGFSTKSSFSSSGQAGSSPPAIPVPVVTSTALVVKSSPQYSIFGYQPPSSFSSWSGASQSVPSVPSFQPSWAGVSGFYPSSSSSLPQAPASSSLSGVSGYYPTSGPLPQPPASSSSSGISGYYPTSGSLTQTPGSSFVSGISGYYPFSAGSPQTTSTTSPASWSSVSGSFPSSSQIPQAPSTFSTPLWSSLSGSVPSRPSQVPVAQQYFVVPTTPAPPALSDQGVSITSEEVSITPPPVGVKSNIVNNIQGPNVALSQEHLPYNPGSVYAASFYPNVFYISNEQYIEKPSTEAPDEGRSSLLSTSVAPASLSSETSSTSSSTESSSVSTNGQTTPITIKSPVQTTFYSSNTDDQTKTPLAYSLQQPIFPPSRGGFYASPVVQNAYPVPVTSVIGTASLGISQPQIVQTVPFARTSSINTYPIPLGYSYQPPPVAFQSGLQAFGSTKSSPVC